MKKLMFLLFFLVGIHLIEKTYPQMSERDRAYVNDHALNKNPQFLEGLSGWSKVGTCMTSTPKLIGLDIYCPGLTGTFGGAEQSLLWSDLERLRITNGILVTVFSSIIIDNVASEAEIVIERFDGTNTTILASKKLRRDRSGTNSMDFMLSDFLPSHTLRMRVTGTKINDDAEGLVQVKDFRIFKSQNNFNPLYGISNQTQAEILLNVGNLTQTTDLSSFTKQNQTGSGIYTLSTDGITFLQDANATIIYSKLAVDNVFTASTIYLNGVAKSIFQGASSSNPGGAAVITSLFKKGDKVTFLGAGSTNSPIIQILATVSVPAVATSKYREPVTKYLSSDITATTADIADLKYSDLVVGKMYEVNLSAYLLHSTAANGVNLLTASNNSDIVCNTGRASDVSWGYLTSGSSSRQCVFTATSSDLVIGYNRVGANLLGNGLPSQTFVSLKQVDSVMQANLLESNIKKDVEQFPLTEQKICDACWNGGALYRKCFNGTQATNDFVLVSGAVGLAKNDLYQRWNTGAIANRFISYPYYFNDTGYNVLTFSSGNLINQCVGVGCTAAFIYGCIEYAK